MPRPVAEPDRRKRQCAILIAVLLVVAVVIATAIPAALIVGGDDNDDNGSNNNDSVSNNEGDDSSSPSSTSNNGPTRSPSAQQSTLYNDDGDNTPTATLSPTSSQRTCNGLANLCNMPVNEILFATMHNANSVAGSVMFFPNHNKDMITALQAGVRGLNMDIGICDTEEGPRLVLVHGLCLVGFSDLVSTWSGIVQFLLDHPTEVVILPTQINDDTGGEVDLAELYRIMQQDVVVGTTSMADLLYAHPPDDTSPWPTLGELIDSNKRLLFFGYNGAQNCQNIACPAGFHDWFAYAAETEFEFATASDIVDDTARSCQITRGSAGTRDFFGVNMFPQIASEEVSAQLNTKEVLLQHLETCSELNDNLPPNLVLVDFWDTGDVIEMVQEYNAGL